MTLGAAFLLATVTVGTWNGEWFPSGRAEHRAAPEIERGTLTAAARILKAGLAQADPAGTNDLILCFNEFRRDLADGTSVPELLCREIGRPDLRVAVISGYRRRDRYDQQQDVIATTLPVASANWSLWKRAKDDTPPRGYARAQVVVSPTVTATVYAVHLKSDYGATTTALADANRAKRTRAIGQLLEQEKPKRGKSAPVIIAGDFNADAWKSDPPDPLFAALAESGFVTPLALWPTDRRVTYPGHGKFTNRALDYIYLRGFASDHEPYTASADGVSDHNPVFVNMNPLENRKRKK